VTALWPFRIAVLSDIHVGPAARSADLTPAWLRRSDEPGFIDTFVEFARTQLGKVDALLIAGDITDQADPTEFQLASKVVEEVAASFGLSWSDIYFVPGNHDSNWKLVRSFPHDTTSFSRHHRYSPFLFGEFPFAERLRQGMGDMCKAPFFSVWNSPRLLVVGFNSSSEDGPAAAPHFGIAPSDSIEELETVLKSYPYKPSQVRLLLVHHHLMDLPSPVPFVPDFSQMQNATSLLELLLANKFDIAVHGHRHLPSFRPWVDPANRQIVVLGAGSFSAKLDTTYSGRVGNQFHLIEVNGRDTGSGSVFGHVNTWSYSIGRAWEAGASSTGLEFVEGFGPYVRPDELVRVAGDEIRKFLAGAETYLAVDALTNAAPSLTKVSSAALDNALAEACAATDTRVIGSPPDRVIVRVVP
jgi:predicted phosphodiesterase